MDSKSYYTKVGRLIKEHRVKLLLTQEDLGYLFGMDRVSINTIEAGRQRLPLHMVTTVSVFLNIDLKEILPTHDYNVKDFGDLRKLKITKAVEKINI